MYALLALLFVVTVDAAIYSVVKDASSGAFSVVSGLPAQYVVSASYSDDIETTGWARLSITAKSGSGMYSSDDIAYAAGWLEAYLTKDRMYQYWINYVEAEYPRGWSSVNPQLISFMQKQYQFAQQIANAPNASDPYVAAVRVVVKQFAGMADGYAKYQTDASKQLTSLQIYVVASAGDLENLNDAFPTSVDRVPRYERATMMDCSALIRVLPDLSDVVTTHTTWRSYYGMLRIYKTYDLKVVPAVTVSSSPLFQHSKDDFGYVSTGLVFMETTNNVYSTDLYKKLSPSTLLSWQRSMVASYVARSSEDWVRAFAKYASGTYTNQWMAIDMNKFVPGSGPQTGFLWIAEEVPGLVAVKDVTAVMQQQGGFWPSYNVPYQQEIFDLAGYPQLVAKYGSEFTYSNCTRAKMFARDAPKTTSIEDVKRVIRYNDWKNDPLSQGNPALSISSRYDLVPSSQESKLRMHAAAFGAIDGKVTSWKMMQQYSSEAVCGPTTDQQPPFVWSTSPFNAESHVGLPDKFDFEWQNY
jgi:hypothetical protein